MLQPMAVQEQAPLVEKPTLKQTTEKIVGELKSRGIFDAFRKECLADVDTRPAYQNLRQRVESTVTAFLLKQKWSPGLNRNLLREKLRKHLTDSPFLEMGVDRIVDQVVDRNIYTTYLPKINQLVKEILGVQEEKEDRLDDDMDLEETAPAAPDTNTFGTWANQFHARLPPPPPPPPPAEQEAAGDSSMSISSESAGSPGNAADSPDIRGQISPLSDDGARQWGSFLDRAGSDGLDFSGIMSRVDNIDPAIEKMIKLELETEPRGPSSGSTSDSNSAPPLRYDQFVDAPAETEPEWRRYPRARGGEDSDSRGSRSPSRADRRRWPADRRERRRTGLTDGRRRRRSRDWDDHEPYRDRARHYRDHWRDRDRDRDGDRGHQPRHFGHPYTYPAPSSDGQQRSSSGHRGQQRSEHGGQQRSEHGGQQRAPAEHGGQQWTPTEQGDQQRTPAKHGGQQWTPAEHGGQQWTPTEHESQQWTPTEQGGQQRTPAEHGGQQRTPTEHGNPAAVPVQFPVSLELKLTVRRLCVAASLLASAQLVLILVISHLQQRQLCTTLVRRTVSCPIPAALHLHGKGG